MKMYRFFHYSAMTVGIMLILLVISMVMKYGFSMDSYTKFIAPAHGFFYILYLISTINISISNSWSIKKIIGVSLLGIVPFLSFYADRIVKRESQV